MKNFLYKILMIAFLFGFSNIALFAQSPENLDKKQRAKVRNDGNFGTVTLRAAIGFYNFETQYMNPTQGIQRNYSLPFASPIVNVELAIRMGSDKEGYHSVRGAGFHYYTSNTGLFTDMELGVKTMGQDLYPSRYQFSQTGGAGATKGTMDVDLGADQKVSDTVTNTVFDPTQPGAQKDGISLTNRKRYGVVAASYTSVYFNNYYRLTPLNWILNFGKGFSWFDASLGPSLRVNHYTDYGDPVRFLNNINDNTWATLMLVYRQYIQPIDILRLRMHYYYPLVGQIARLVKNNRVNQDEHILDVGVDFYLIKFVYVTVGYEYRYWNASPYAANRLNRSTGADFGNTRDGLELKSRTSGDFYLGVAADLALPL